MACSDAVSEKLSEDFETIIECPIEITVTTYEDEYVGPLIKDFTPKFEKRKS